MGFEQSVMPIEYMAYQVGDMKPGESGYSVPWALVVDAAGVVWIDPDFMCHKSAAEPACLHFRRADDHMIVDSDTIGSHRYFNSSLMRLEESHIPVVLKRGVK